MPLLPPARALQPVREASLQEHFRQVQVSRKSPKHPPGLPLRLTITNEELGRWAAESSPPENLLDGQEERPW